MEQIICTNRRNQFSEGKPSLNVFIDGVDEDDLKDAHIEWVLASNFSINYHMVMTNYINGTFHGQ
jgi:hypothetical protein